MARRGRYGKIQTQVPEPLNPSSDVPSSQVETETEKVPMTLVNSVDVNSIDVLTAEGKEKRSCVKRNVKTTSLAVRRSERLVNSPIQVDYMEPVIEEITLAAVEKMGVAEDDKLEELSPNEENNTGEKPQEEPEVQPVETSGAVNLNYRSLYIHSQKKVKSLKKKNRLLSQKLENALGKIEVYTEMRSILSSMSKSNEILCKRPWSITKRQRT